MLETLITRAAADDEQERQNAVLSIHVGMEDFAAGRWVGIEDMLAESRVARSAGTATPA